VFCTQARLNPLDSGWFVDDNNALGVILAGYRIQL